MKQKFILLAVLLLTTIINIFPSDYLEYYFKVPYQSNKMIKELNEICSVDNFDNQFVYAYANPKQFSKVAYSFPNYELLTNPSNEFPIPVAMTREEMRDWDSYPSYSTYVDMMNQFALDYPNLCSVESFGTSIDNRDLLVAKISDNVSIDEAEPEFFYSGQMHGDEIVCYVLFLRLIDYLLENYDTDPEIAEIVNSTQIYINPLSNPDGLYTDNDNTINGATRYNANGIDLNRNFPSPIGDEHPDDNAWQPENIAMMNFSSQHRFVMSSNSHSGAVVVNYPWDTWSRRHPDDNWFQYVSRLYADTVHENAPSPYMTDYNNGITNGYDWYQTFGNRQDWFNYELHCREITIELSFNKALPANQLNDHWEYNYQSMIKWLKEVNYGIQGIVTDAEGNPLEAKIEILNHDLEQDNSCVFSSPLHGDYYRPIYAGEYSMKISAEGYESQIIDNVIVENNSATVVNVALNEAVLTSFDGYIYDLDSQAINNAIITVTNSSTYEVSSNEIGYFNIPEIYSGQYFLTVTGEGYQTYTDYINLTAEPETLEIFLNESNAISFETELSPEWYSTTTTGWSRSDDQAYDGSYSLKSGNINNSRSTDIQIDVNNQQSVVSFYYKVSSEESYDFLNFYINDTQMGSWSGEVDWSYAEFAIPEGNNTLKWEYVKDVYVGEGSDCAWIDLVELPALTDNNCNEDVNIVIEPISCYPNPFNPEVNIRFYQSANNPISNISIYNIKGQKVSELKDLPQIMGYHNTVWYGRDAENNNVASGIYFVVVDDGVHTHTKKILLMK